MTANVDPDTCTGCGLCVEICPEVFELDESVAIVRVDPVPTEAEAACRDAMGDCPVEAISVQE